MRDQYITTGDGFLIVYSVGAASSAERIPELYDRILLVKNANSWPAVLCANKSDLPPSQVR
jgi:GTPase KRas protein